MAGVVCDRQVQGRVKGKVYETVLRPVMFVCLCITGGVLGGGCCGFLKTKY